MSYVPRYVFFTKGVGYAKAELASFEDALRDASIAPFNLVSVSSILPPRCKTVSVKKGVSMLKPGQIVHCVMARLSSNEPNRLLAASIGCAFPRNRDKYGYLSEHHSYGERCEVAGEYAEDLAATMLATTLGIEFDVDRDWNEKKEYFKMEGQIVKTKNVTQSAVVPKEGKWTTVLAAAVFVP